MWYKIDVAKLHNNCLDSVVKTSEKTYKDKVNAFTVTTWFWEVNHRLLCSKVVHGLTFELESNGSAFLGYKRQAVCAAQRLEACSGN